MSFDILNEFNKKAFKTNVSITVELMTSLTHHFDIMPYLINAKDLMLLKVVYFKTKFEIDVMTLFSR